MPKKHTAGRMTQQERTLRTQRIIMTIIGAIIILSMLASLMTTY